MANEPISRRSFLKGVAAGAASVVALGALQGMEYAYSGKGKDTAEGADATKGQPSTAASPAGATAEAAPKGTPAPGATYIPGTYQATASGIGEITVTMTFDADKITDVKIDVSQETADIGGVIGEDMEKAILDAQSAEVDSVSGATVTSAAISQAAAACIAQAKGEAVAEPAKKPGGAAETFAVKDLTQADLDNSDVILSEITDFDEEITVDIAVCGAGAAGVVAAVTAVEEGATVCVLQKEAAAVSQGNCASAIVKSGSTEQGLRKWIQECTAFNSWRSDPKLLQAYIDHSEDALRWVCERSGITEQTEWKNEAAGLSRYQDTSTVFTGEVHDGANYYNYGAEKVEIFAPWFGPKPKNVGDVVSLILSDAQEEHGSKLDVRFSTPVVQLLKDSNGAVVGCIGRTGTGKYVKVNAKSVILATGAYENNPTMVRKFCPDSEAFDKKVFHRTGDGNILAIEAGGCMEPVAHSKVMHDFDAGLMYDEPFLFVNMNGERFVNETVEMAYISNILRYQPAFKGKNLDSEHSDGSKGWYCQIYDNDYMSYAKAGVPETVMQRYLADEDPSLHTGVFEALIDTFRANTIEELAAKLEVPADALKASVERYNEMCDSGDVDFGKDSAYLHKIQTAPFWGIRRHIRCSSITAGVLTDANSQVITEEGVPIGGLYAVGNLGGQFFGAPDYPFFQGGLSIGHAFTFGRIAALHATGKI